MSAIWIINSVLILGLHGIVLGGLKRGVVPQKKKGPNEGIHLSMRNIVLGGLICGIISGIVGTLILGIVFGIIAGGIILLGGGWWYGGQTVIKHYTLRFLLWLKGATPRNYARFLDYAAELVFLQKAGGSYIFIHRLLLEHFAVMDELNKKSEATNA